MTSPLDPAAVGPTLTEKAERAAQQPGTRTLTVIARWEPYGGGQQQLRLHLSEALIAGPSTGETLWPAAEMLFGKAHPDAWTLTPFGTNALTALDQTPGLEALTVGRYQLRLLPGLAWTQTPEQRDDYAETATRAVRTAWEETRERPQ